MESCSERFRAGPTSEVIHLSWVDVYKAGQAVRDVTGAPMRLAPVGGSVIFDRDAETRSSLSMQVACVDEWGTDLVPDPENPTLSPLEKGVAELRPFMGYLWPDGAQEVVAMGRYRVKKVGAAEDNNGVPLITVEAFDSSWVIRQSPRVAYRIAPVTPNGQAFTEILHRKDPTIVVFAADTPYTVPTSLVIGLSDSPWARAQEVAGAAGCVGYFDRRGIAVMAPLITAVSDPVYALVEGPDATFTTPEVLADMEEAPNVVTIIGTSGGSNASAQATAADTTPGSPTNVDVIGEFTETIRSPLYGSDGQCAVAAAARLRQSLAGNERVTVTAGRMAALDVEDTVTITREQLHLRGRSTVVTRIEYPLVEPTMDINFQRFPTDNRAVA